MSIELCTPPLLTLSCYFVTPAGLMGAYLFFLRSLVLVCCYSLRSRHLALALVGLLTTLTSFTTGFTLHHNDLPSWLGWLRWVYLHYLVDLELTMCLIVLAHSNDLAVIRRTV